MREESENVFGIRRNPLTTICPIKSIGQYLDVARQIRVDLTRGYLFRPTSTNGGIQDSPFTSATAEVRLKVYLKKIGSDNGETLHGFRSGCVITLALTGEELSEIIGHVGSSNRHTALYYMPLAKVLNPCWASAKLASSEVFNIPNAWQDINELKRFVCAFPTDNPHKRLLSQ